MMIIAAGFVLFALGASLLFWYEKRNETAPPFGLVPGVQAAPGAVRPSGDVRPGPAACLRLFLHSLAGYFIGVFLHPVGWAHSWKVRPCGTKGGKPPLILIHGINDNSSVWLRAAPLFKKRGYAVSTYSYFSLFVPLEKVLSGLEEHVRRVEAACPGRKPVFVCHSLGGVLVRRWLLDEANRRRAGGVATLATPHRGSKLAALAPGTLARCIRPASQLIATLAEPSPREPFPCVSLVTPTDEAVLPAANLLPPEGWRLVVTENTSHFCMLWRGGVLRALLDEVENISGNAS